MTDTTATWIPLTLSDARFAPYVARAAGDPQAALALYWWNVKVSEAFYSSLHCVELALRNSLHEQLRRGFGRADWWTVAPLTANTDGHIAKARAKAGRGTADDVVAQLTFGSWVALLSNSYHRTLWVPMLHRAFPRNRIKRSELHRDFFSVLLLRNRIAHFEPIHHRHLAADHATIHRLLGYISPEMLAELRRHDKVPEVLSLRGKL